MVSVKSNPDHPVFKNAHLFYKQINEYAKKHKAKEHFFGASPNIFVGRFGYPNVNVGFLANENVNEEYDNPKLWFEKKFDIPQIASMRSMLINNNFQNNIKSFDDRLFEITRNVGMASKPVDVEVNLNKKPHYTLEFNGEITPFGPTVKITKAQITENVKIPHKVEKVYSDDDLKASEAVNYLSKNEFDEHYLTKLLSAGTIGLKSKRKLVPTRWSITAVDDTLGKQQIARIKNFTSDVGFELHYGNYMGNHYIVMFFPDIWGYELFETYTKEKSIFTDYEDYSGRRQYAFNTVGGYYAARLGVTEYLTSRRKQGSALLLRFVTDEYWMHLGVWVVRQTVRKVLQQKPVTFHSKEEMLSYCSQIIKSFGFRPEQFLNESKLLNQMKTQTKLSSFF